MFASKAAAKTPKVKKQGSEIQQICNAMQCNSRPHEIKDAFQGAYNALCASGR